LGDKSQNSNGEFVQIWCINNFNFRH
jgi:hypothetical protein